MSTITDPHPNAYVTVVGNIAHRSAPWKADSRAAASCSAAIVGGSISYGWAAHLGATPCREPGCYAPPGDRLWMATRRRGINHHRLQAGETKTDCNRFAGEDTAGEYDNGLTITAAEAEELESKPCKQCWPVGANG